METILVGGLDISFIGKNIKLKEIFTIFKRDKYWFLERIVGNVIINI